MREYPDGFPAGESTASWCAFADYLHDLTNSVLAAAIQSRSDADPLYIDDGRHRRLAMDHHAVDQLTAKLDHHARVAFLLGFDESRSPQDEQRPTPVDSSVRSAYVSPIDLTPKLGPDAEQSDPPVDPMP